MGKLAHFFAARPAWTLHGRLPGGDFDPQLLPTVIDDVRQRWRFLTEAHARRLVLAYGTRVERILAAAKNLDDLGTRFGADLTAAEVRYLMEEEWAETVDDVLWRRSKLGLRISPREQETLARFMTTGVEVET